MSHRRCHHLSRLWAVLLVAGVLTTVFGGGAANAGPSGPHVEPVRAEEDNFDAAAAKRALAKDPVYIAPGALARLDRDRLRNVTATGKLKVVAVSELASYRQVRDAFDKGYRRSGEVVLLLFGLRITVLADKPVYVAESDEVLVRHRRAVQQTHDMTAVVTDVVAKMRGRGPVAPVWRPRIVPAESGQLAEIVRALEVGGGYEHPEAPETFRDVSYVQRRHRTLPFRLVRMPVLTPDTPQSDLLGPLRKQFPEDVVVITWGDWLEAAGPDSATVAAALAIAARDGSVDRLLSVVRGRRAGEVRDRPALVVPPTPPPVPRWPGVALGPQCRVRRGGGRAPDGQPSQAHGVPRAIAGRRSRRCGGRPPSCAAVDAGRS